MSHLHLPDGVLPVWLWASGLILAIFIAWLFSRLIRREDLTRRLPLLGMMAAAMVLGASVEIVPIAYHVNLTVATGILLGPYLIFLVTFVVNFLLALFGHGGLTVIGLNTLILSIEGILGYFFFRVFWRISKRIIPSIFLATFLALSLSTFFMIGVVRLGVDHYEELLHSHEEKGLFEFKLLKEKDHQPQEISDKVNFRRFVSIVLPLGFLGWLLEGAITSLILRYIYRLRPELLRLTDERGNG